MRTFVTSFLFSVALLCSASSGNAGDSIKSGDWPQWRGPNRDAVCSETGLLKAWPKGGPKLLWDSRKVNGGKSSVGVGFSSLAIVHGKIYTIGDHTVSKQVEFKKKDKIQKKTIRTGDTFVFCIDAPSGKEIWKKSIGPASNAGPPGPRSTPTVDGDRVYALTPQGNLVCVKTTDGSILWQKNFSKDFKGNMMSGWAYSESPTIDGDKLICTPGGKDAIMVALNKLTGDLYWKCQAPKAAGAGYASIVKTEAAGVKQYITIVGPQLGLVGVDADTGKFLWSYNRIANGTANIPTPIVKGEYVFASTGYRQGGSALLKLVADGSGGIKVEEQYYYDEKQLQNHHGGMVMLGDYIYGGHGHNKGFPFCLEWKTGKLAWGRPDRGPGDGSAAVLYADGRLYFRYENGVMALIEASPKGYNLISSFRPQIGGNGWPHPVIYQGRLYLRGTDQILCYDIKQN